MAVVVVQVDEAKKQIPYASWINQCGKAKKHSCKSVGQSWHLKLVQSVSQSVSQTTFLISSNSQHAESLAKTWFQKSIYCCLTLKGKKINKGRKNVQHFFLFGLFFPFRLLATCLRSSWNCTSGWSLREVLCGVSSPLISSHLMWSGLSCCD